MALHLCASAGKKAGFGALRKCKSDASDASHAPDASYIEPPHPDLAWDYPGVSVQVNAFIHSFTQTAPHVY